MTDKPDACPHCGGPSELTHVVAGPKVTCDSCLASGPAIDCSEAITDEDFAAADLEAVKAWNERAADKARIAELVEALRHFIDADSQPSGISGKYGNALTQAVDKLKQEHDQRIAFAVAALAKSGSGEES